MNVTSPNRCPQCGQTISQGVNGLCPNCLALVAFGAEANAEQTVLENADDPSGREARPLLSLTARYFGDYELLEEIARGGMGVVYKARQVKLNRIVAVKMILGGQLASPTDIRRFLTEAEAAANLQHPNIVAIHEVSEHEGRHYFSMDYVEGQNLADYSRDNPLPANRAAQLIKTIAEAIHFAHQRGTLHRDLKPQNVVIDPAGQPRITDFGLAKRYGVPPSGGSGLQPAKAGTTNELTQTGAVMGSPGYMSPEQAAGKNEHVGPSSDVYSIGAMLYHLLTGAAPFKGETPVATLRKVMEEEPAAPSKLNPQIPPDLETICLKCLEKRPDRRYHSARELVEELDRFLNHEPILAKPASAWRKGWNWSRRNPWAIIGAATVVGLVLLGMAYGLWERVKYLEGRLAPRFYDPFLVCFIGWWSMVPLLLFGRWLKAMRQRNVPISNLQLSLLAGAGLLLMALGLWVDMMYIRLFVWKRPDFAWQSWQISPAIAAFGLSMALLFCWMGGIMVWQAVHRQQAHWLGLSVAEQEWLPRQPVHYSTGAHLAATLANLVLFAGVGYLGVAAGLFDRLLNAVGASREAKTVLVTSFVLIAWVVSTACWFYRTRKLYRRPPLVTLLLSLLLGGAALSWFSSGAPHAWTVVLPAILAGLAGGWVLTKWVKIRQEPMEALTPLVLGDVFQWDRRALAISLPAVLAVLALMAGLLMRSLPSEPAFYMFFLAGTAANVLWPIFYLAVRATTGTRREPVLFILGSLPLFGLPPLVFGASGNIPQLLATLPLGVTASCALIYFGKIRPKAR